MHPFTCNRCCHRTSGQWHPVYPFAGAATPSKGQPTHLLLPPAAWRSPPAAPWPSCARRDAPATRSLAAARDAGAAAAQAHGGAGKHAAAAAAEAASRSGERVAASRLGWGQGAAARFVPAASFAQVPRSGASCWPRRLRHPTRKVPTLGHGPLVGPTQQTLNHHASTLKLQQ